MTLLLSLLACQFDTTFFSPPDVEPPPDGYGVISGRVCDLSGYAWVADATVYINVQDATGRFIDMMETTSDADGYWALEEVPEGYGILVYVQKGDSIIETHSVDVFANQETRIENEECFDPATLDVAVITGDYDSFDQVLDAIGVDTYRLIDGLYGDEMLDFLMDVESMREYDVIVFNGGHVEDGIFYDLEDSTNNTPTQVKANILNYVQGGGSIYASDWAYNVVETVWPDAIDFLGTDHVPDDAQKGSAGTVNASISNLVMQDFLADDDGMVTVSYDLPVWPPIESSSLTSSVHLLGSVYYREDGQDLLLSSSPLLVSFNGGGGRVVYSTFRVAPNASDEMLDVMKYIMFEL